MDFDEILIIPTVLKLGITTALIETDYKMVMKVIKFARHHGMKSCFDQNIRKSSWKLVNYEQSLLE
jgi:hypothetical protein